MVYFVSFYKKNVIQTFVRTKKCHRIIITPIRAMETLVMTIIHSK